MKTNKMRTALLTLFALLGIAGLTLAFSPNARAAVRAAFSINGVEVYEDEETGNYTVEGNTDAVIYQDDDTVVIEHEGEDSYSYIDQSNEQPSMMTIEELSSAHPDFVLPTNIPDGYTLIPMAFINSETSYGIGWQNDQGHQLTYTIGMEFGVFAEPDEEVSQAIKEAGYETSDDLTEDEMVKIIAEETGYSVRGNMSRLRGTRTDGVTYEFLSMGAVLTEAEFEAMVP